MSPETATRNLINVLAEYHLSAALGLGTRSWNSWIRRRHRAISDFKTNNLELWSRLDPKVRTWADDMLRRGDGVK